MKTLNSSAGWRKLNSLAQRALIIGLGSLLAAGLAWGDAGRGRGHDSRREFNERASRWRELPPERQDELRRSYEKFRRLPTEQQQRIRQEYQRFRQLPDEERRAVKERWRQLSPAERREYRRQLRERVQSGRDR